MKSIWILAVMVSSCGYYAHEERVRDGKTEECSVSCYGWSEHLSDYCKKQLENCVIID